MFEAWTDLDHLSVWWAPEGYRPITEAIDVNPGGLWRYVLRGPDGENYQNEIRYREVLEPQRLEFSHGSGEENDADGFDVTVTLVDSSLGTELTVRLVFATVDERSELIEEYGVDEGVEQALDRLAHHLAAVRQE